MYEVRVTSMSMGGTVVGILVLFRWNKFLMLIHNQQQYNIIIDTVVHVKEKETVYEK